MKLKVTGKILLELPPVSDRILRPFIVGHLLQLLVGRDGGVALPLHSEGSLGISDTEVIVRTVCKYDSCYPDTRLVRIGWDYLE